ncbi:DNA polymerase Y family protein [Micromonospora sp. 4G57]|uniref:DNA polymerase Y family protein n=1 Tax=Micromonospora sicca TaxID=2202420 RepID=A0ABU5JI36_9ACTN|nr:MULTISPECIES: DNA polymerase Y family protein [unclassified Micromonospora]MDZ5442733.1 DNA polymerase Y family protein [Micromonospora sp. 4G57]MDZ5492167.1 DNA polymerase Y family protein [Micromonospora sp. 4G53]
MTAAPVRTLLLWCPDWPVLAAEIVDGVPATDPVAVLHANRVVACSERARAEGVRRGLRRREAQARCPQLTVVEYDPDRDVRAFEPVVAAVEEVAAGVEVVRPGACALAARGPSRYLGGEEAAAERIVEHVAQSCAVESQVGIADGVFAAGLAARDGRIVPPGGTPEFLADLPVEALGRPALADLLRRLGVRTLGGFAALPAGDVLARFGFDGALVHRLAAGQDHRPLAVRQPPADLTVTADHDEPIDRVDAAAFAARMLAEQLHERLAAYGLACTRLGIEAVTAHGQELHRVWRHDGLLTAAAIADRVRWQLDGWLSGSTGRGGARPTRPTAGIIRLRLVPDGVLAQAGLQSGLWGETGEERERAHRALSRVQGILGPEAVVTAVLGGGRSPADQVQLVPWGDERLPARPGPPPLPQAPAGPDGAPGPARPGEPARPGQSAGSGAVRRDGTARSGGSARSGPPPWPGRLPPPAPAVVLPTPLAAAVHDAAGEPVVVSARLQVSAAPARLAVGTARPAEIVGWAGPWPVDERWWAPAEARRRARFQVCLADGAALLLAVEAGQWLVEAIYD